MPRYPEIETEDGKTIRLPHRWVICDSCNGNATTTRHIECEGGGFTGSEWAEACSEDPDFAEDYFGGAYDRPCPECRGTGKVAVVDDERCPPDLLAIYNENAEIDLEIAAERAAERRFGC